MAAPAAALLERGWVPAAEPELSVLQPDDSFSALGGQAAEWLQSFQPLGLTAETDARPLVAAADFAGQTAVANTARVQDLRVEADIQAEYARGLGAVAVGGAAERPAVQTETSNITGLRSALERAAHGDSESIASNIRASLSESLTNAGIMPDIHLARSADGRIEQGGQDLYSVAKNTLEQHPGSHTGLHQVAQTEGLNYHALDVLDKAGYFDAGNVWVVPRLAPANTPARAIREYGYFENLAVSWSFVWKTGPGSFVVRPMFTAGVNPEAHEEPPDRKMTAEELDMMYAKRLDRRHDIFAVSGVYRDLDLPVPEDIAGFQRGFLMHRSSFKDPAHPEADIAGRYDDQLGPSYHLGGKGQRGDYVVDGQVRAAALHGLRGATPAIINELLAHSGELADDMAVATMMAKLVKRYAVDYVIDHKELLPIIGSTLGLATQRAIETGPQLAGGDAGQWRVNIHSMARAQTCGFGMFGLDALIGVDSKGSLVFTCGNGHINVRGFNDTNARCAECLANVACKPNEVKKTEKDKH